MDRYTYVCIYYAIQFHTNFEMMYDKDEEMKNKTENTLIMV